jgi:plastocyanin
MRRTTVLAALPLLLLALGPGRAAAEPVDPTTAPATTTATTDTLATAGTTTTSTVATTTTTTDPPTTTSPVPTTEHRPFAQPRAAQAAQAATVSVGSGGPGCSTFCFSPGQTTIETGGTVTFTNPSDVAHTVKRCTPAACAGASGGTGDDAAFSSTTIALPSNATAHYTFTQPGTYVYYCTLHGYALMHGTIAVTAAAPATTVAPAPTAATAPTATTTGPNGLASTGGAVEPLVSLAEVLLVAGLAAAGLSRRRAPGRDR